MMEYDEEHDEFCSLCDPPSLFEKKFVEIDICKICLPIFVSLLARYHAA